MTIGELDLNTKKEKITIIDVTDPEELIGLPIGPANFTISAPNFQHKIQLFNITPSTKDISLQGRIQQK